MELIIILLESLGCFAEFLNFIVVSLDILSWFKAKPNRASRRDAKRKGQALPKRDTWSRVFILLTPVAIILSIFVIWKWIR
jgi:hypothetical protein